jgi:hypothetical protein
MFLAVNFLTLHPVLHLSSDLKNFILKSARNAALLVRKGARILALKFKIYLKFSAKKSAKSGFLFFSARRVQR